MKNYERIVLTGFMGSGKSAIGKRVAQHYKIPFYDLDKEIESNEKVSIPELFKTRGEAYFRHLEKKYINEFMNQKPYVLALGGGALIQKEARDSVMQNALLIFLDVPDDVLLERLKRDKKRPMLRNEDGKLPEASVLMERIQSLMSKRRPIYELADITIRVNAGWEHARTTNETIKSISQYAATKTSSDNRS